MELWDGYYRDETPAGMDLVRGDKIPQGIYHIVCEALVRHSDGDYLLMQRDRAKPSHGGRFEASAGGSALKGENALDCIKREIHEETGISDCRLKEIGRFVKEEGNCIFHVFLCRTDCKKDSVALQEGETISYRWLSESEFISFIHSGEMIPSQKARYASYFIEQGYMQPLSK